MKFCWFIKRVNTWDLNVNKTENVGKTENVSQQSRAVQKNIWWWKHFGSIIESIKSLTAALCDRNTATGVILPVSSPQVHYEVIPCNILKWSHQRITFDIVNHSVLTWWCCTWHCHCSLKKCQCSWCIATYQPDARIDLCYFLGVWLITPSVLDRL